MFGAVEMDVIMVREGDVVLVMLHVSIGFNGPDSALTEVIARKAHAKLR